MYMRLVDASETGFKFPYHRKSFHIKKCVLNLSFQVSKVSMLFFEHYKIMLWKLVETWKLWKLGNSENITLMMSMAGLG